MNYNFAQYKDGVNLYFIIDMVVLVTVFAVMLSFFVYKRNMKVFSFSCSARCLTF